MEKIGGTKVSDLSDGGGCHSGHSSGLSYSLCSYLFILILGFE
jgi:hypothetical protein